VAVAGVAGVAGTAGYDASGYGAEPWSGALWVVGADWAMPGSW